MEYSNRGSMERRKKALILREEVECMKDWAMECLRKPSREGETRKKAALRVIKLGVARSRAHLGSVRVQVYEVAEGDSEDP